MTTLLISHPSFAQHDTGPGHPERIERVRAIDVALSAPEFDALLREEARLPDDIETHILRAHTKGLLDRARACAKEAMHRPSYLDPDTVMSPGTWEAVQRAVGAVMRGVDAVYDPEAGIHNVFCQVRPPGHHAESNRSMGFCVLNSVAIAALYAKAHHSAERVAVIDFDVHHGNGTQDIFWSDKTLFYGSTHQMPHYPGTGSVSERGVGNIWNAPLRSGEGGVEFRAAMDRIILPSLDEFAPDIILVSAGFDAHLHDPLGGLRLVESDYQWVTEKLMDAAARHCKGRLVSALEGGYSVNDLASSVATHVRTLMKANDADDFAHS